jgi:hypothetical protein
VATAVGRTQHWNRRRRVEDPHRDRATGRRGVEEETVQALEMTQPRPDPNCASLQKRGHKRLRTRRQTEILSILTRERWFRKKVPLITDILLAKNGGGHRTEHDARSGIGDR